MQSLSAEAYHLNYHLSADQTRNSVGGFYSGWRAGDSETHPPCWAKRWASRSKGRAVLTEGLMKELGDKRNQWPTRKG